MLLRARLLLLATLFLAGCDLPAVHPSLRKAELPPLLPAHEFSYFGATQGSYLMSPDGRRLAWVGPRWGRATLFVRENSTGEVRTFRAWSNSYQWTHDGRRMLYVGDGSGTENTHVYMLDVDDPRAQPVNLTPFPNVRAVIHQVLQKDPDQLLIYHNRRDPRLFDLYRVDLNTRQETLIARNPGHGVSPTTSTNGAFLGWVKPRDAQRPAPERLQPHGTRKPGLVTKPDETFRVLGPGPDHGTVWALSDRGRERTALVVADPKLGWEKVHFEDERVDVSNVTMSRVTRAPLVASALPGYPRHVILDASLREDLKELLSAQGDAPFGLAIVSSDDAELRMVVQTHTSTQRRHYLLDRSKRTFVLLAETLKPELAGALTAMEPISLKSRDGLTLHGYLTLPVGKQARELPMVLYVHGGPWSRTAWSDPVRSDDANYAHFLANRGYAVLQIDFRGSSGYGKRHRSAAIGEFGGKMQDDLLDAVQWAIERGIADRDKIAIMGYSYGGYAALMALTQTPRVFACGVSLAGPTHLATLIESFPQYWSVDLSMWRDFVGDPAIEEDRAQMDLISPLTNAASMERPVLIVHGAKDVRVRIDQAQRMIDALMHEGKAVEHLLIDDMGHSMGYWAHRLAVLRKTENFLHRCLGGRASRFDPFEAIAWAWKRLKS